MSDEKIFGIHWFRRDLRVQGNPAFSKIYELCHGKVLGLFCFDQKFLNREDFSHNRFSFFLYTLSNLQKELNEMGVELLVVDETPERAFPKILEYWKKNKEILPRFISWNRDYEPYARKRDQIILSLLESYGVSVFTERDHLILEPHEILKDEKKQSYYQIYTPFSKKWLAKIGEANFRIRIEQEQKIKKINSHENIKKWGGKDFPFRDALATFLQRNQKKVSIPIPPSGYLVAMERLRKFRTSLGGYHTARDIPALDGTSKLSMYLKNGSIASSQIISELGLPNSNSGVGKEKFLKEIIWREFYYSILFHEPRVEHESFLEKYKNLEWKNREDWFQIWCEGRTGFPIVDAGMRELNSTGWMHNRVRMIVASFLTKDLLIDWRWGENYFMKNLLDGDLAANNGGWQWASSTGCDPQPYFRIFNPWLQGERFDPQAEYIKKHIPELKNTSVKEIHHPDGYRGSQYPRPIVSHKIQQGKALQLYKKAQAQH